MKTFVSVIIDTYNYARFIDKAIESVLSQDYPQELIEIIVVDDGSTDNTKEVVSKYGNKVKFIYKENGGQASAFNTGINEAKGDIIALLDADDTWGRSKLGTIVPIFESNKEVGIVRHYMQNIDQSGVVIDKTETSYSMPDDNDINELLKNRIYTIGSSGLAFRKDYLNKVMPIPKGLFICPDEYLFSGVLLNSKLVTIKTFLAQRRLHSSNSGLYIDNILDTRRLKDYAAIRRLLDEHLRLMISKQDLRFDNSIYFLSELGIIRAELILLSLANKRLEALNYLLKAFFKYKLSKHLIFKFMTFSLIVLSPKLYSNIFAKYYKMRKN